jgi:hypothetical protein
MDKKRIYKNLGAKMERESKQISSGPEIIEMDEIENKKMAIVFL